MKVLNVYALMQGIEKYVVAGAVPGLTAVAWHDDDSAFTDGTTIHLPRPDSMWNEEQLLLWRYKAEHELGHEAAINANPHWKEVMEEKRKQKEYKDDGMLWWISNLISDHVQEHNRVGEMIGRDEVLLQGRRAFLEDGERQKAKMLKDSGAKENPDMNIASALFAWDTEARMGWNPHLSAQKMDAKVKPIYDMIKTKGGVDPTKLKNEEEVFNAALKIRKLFPEYSSKNTFMKIKMPGTGKPGGKGKPGDGEDADGVRTDRQDPFLPNGQHGEAAKRKYDYEKGEGSYRARLPGNLKSGKRKYGFDHGKCGHHVSAVSGLMRRTNLPAKVRAYLMAMKREKYTTGYRSGRLDTNRLTDVLRGKDDLFRRKEAVRLVDSAVYLLVDSSGSMSGSAFQSACASALMMAEALQGIGCSVEIAGFTEFGGDDKGLIHDIWLPFGQRFVKENVLNQMAVMANALSNNVDGENILFAYNRLKQQKESRKILIVLSDGQPAGSGAPGNTIGPGQFTKNVCDTIQRDKSVLLVGLGMSGYSPKKFYKNAYQVDRGQSLEGVLLNIVKDAVLKHE